MVVKRYETHLDSTWADEGQSGKTVYGQDRGNALPGRY